MSPNLKECVSSRTELIQVHSYCPERPYVELMVPSDAKKIVSVTFTTWSRDQGWADDSSGFSYSWFDCIVRRSPHLTDLPVFTIYSNRTANPEFLRKETRWDLQSGARIRLWIEGLQPGDIIGILPRAAFPARVNIIWEAGIKLEYETYDEKDVKHATGQLGSLTLATNVEDTEFYRRRLESDEHEIRLLVVEPGRYDDPIRCSFDYARLEEPGSTRTPVKFDALSYCWFSTTGSTSILLDPNFDSNRSEPWSGHEFAVGRNVETALRRFRLEAGTLSIWIDAICINQKDLEERAQQVSIMGPIYSQASTVYIWLGEGNLLVDASVRVIHDLYNFLHGTCPGAEACECTTAGISRHNASKRAAEVEGWQREPVSLELLDKFWGVITRTFSDELNNICEGWYNAELDAMMGVLYQHPWFTRIWVLQEAILARRAFICSSAEAIPWEEVIAISKLVIGNFRPHLKWRAVLPPVWGQLSRSRSAVLEAPEPRSSPDQDPSDSEQSPSVDPKPVNILDVFTDALGMKATDSRDKLYALFSFAQETRNPTRKQELELDRLIRPSYSKPLEVVLADFTRWWIQTHQSLAILSHIHANPSRAWRKMTGTEENSLLTTSANESGRHPTWIIGTEGRSWWARATLESQFSFHATGTTTPCIHPNSGGIDTDNKAQSSVLRLDGVHVAEITKIGHFPIEFLSPYSSEDDEDDEIGEVFNKLLDPTGAARFWSLEANSAEAPPSDINLVYMRYRDHLEAHWEYVNRDKLVAIAPPSSVIEDDEVAGEHYETDELPTCLDPCYFLTSDGSHGLCPQTAKKGDIVVLLYGGNVPYLLRPVIKSKEEMENRDGSEELFELVGECYVQGIMQGEFLEEEGIKDGLDTERKIFTLV